MSLEAAIHERWASDLALSDLVPAERVYTGVARGTEELPYVVVTRARSEAQGRTSSGTELRQVVVRFDVWGADLDGVKAIGSAMRGAFNRQGFAVAEGVCQLMQWQGETERGMENGAWHLAVDYVARIAAGFAA